jgi:hypothetical protein
MGTGDEQHMLEGIVHALDMEKLLKDDIADAPRRALVIAAFEWIVDLHNESMTPWVRQSAGFMIRGTANSKIVASFLQRRQKPGNSP